MEKQTKKMNIIERIIAHYVKRYLRRSGFVFCKSCDDVLAETQMEMCLPCEQDYYRTQFCNVLEVEL